MEVAGKLAFLSFHKLWVLSHDFYWEKQTYKLYLASENTRFPSPLETFREEETSPAAKSKPRETAVFEGSMEIYKLNLKVKRCG